jgi:hypothetical protein
MLEEHRDSVWCAANLVSHSATAWDLKNVHPLLLGRLDVIVLHDPGTMTKG